MSASWGNKLRVSIFGESHSEAIGIVVDGLPCGVALDIEAIEREMARRAPNGGIFSTPRKESDRVRIVSGFFNGATTGTPLCGIIVNENTKSSDYDALKDVMRPSHSDYGYRVKSGGYNDYRGGGHSSGRLTAPLVFCGAICKQLLARRNIVIGAHLAAVGTCTDDRFATDVTAETLADLNGKALPLLDASKEEAFAREIANAREAGDSVGGIVECAVVGVPAGVGEPFFRSVESQIASLLFSVPAVKGVQFGEGYGLSRMRGSQANDSFVLREGKVETRTNRNGGVLGGIATGMPIVFDAAIKPTPSIFLPQDTVDLARNRNVSLTIKGRHDPCVAVRAVPVIEAVAAMAIYDLSEG